ncbi:MAG: hypothetical protein KIT69_07125 [Propionibacteriaceae bacterium]|nr:hypothetical protein [Propionibacteriaceae bacterium]
MKNTELLDKPIHPDMDLHQYWLELMSPLGFSHCRLYFVFLDRERRAVRQLHEISDLPVTPDHDFLDAFMSILAHFAESFAFALLLTRPGHHPMDPHDKTWARELVAASGRAGIQLEPIYFANDDCLVPFAGDDLVG